MTTAADRYANAVLASKGAAFLPVAEQTLGAKARSVTWHVSHVEGWLMDLMYVISLSSCATCAMMQVCPRCCLRHAGIRGDIYAFAAPSASELLSALHALSAGSSSPSQPAQEASAPAYHPGIASNGHAQAPDTAAKPDSEHTGAKQSAPSSPSGRTPVAAQAAEEANGSCGQSERFEGPAGACTGEHSQDRLCSVCLGILQTVDSRAPATPSEAVTAAVQQWDSRSGRSWHPSAFCCPMELARSAK